MQNMPPTKGARITGCPPPTPPDIKALLGVATFVNRVCSETHIISTSENLH